MGGGGTKRGRKETGFAFVLLIISNTCLILHYGNQNLVASGNQWFQCGLFSSGSFLRHCTYIVGMNSQGLHPSTWERTGIGPGWACAFLDKPPIYPGYPGFGVAWGRPVCGWAPWASLGALAHADGPYGGRP